MAFIVSHNPTEIPVRADGAKWVWAFATGSGQAVFADTLSEIIAQIIPGYGDLPESDWTEDAHLEARIDSLGAFLTQCQELIVASLEQAGKIDTSALSDDDWTVLFSPKNGPVLVFDAWTAGIPLLLLASSYKPYTQIERPSGNQIVWLDPVTESSYLESLNTIGAGDFMRLSA